MTIRKVLEATVIIKLKRQGVNSLKLLKIIVGSILTLIGALGSFVGIVAIIDPIGTKMADDNNPFGVPPTTLDSWGMLGIHVMALFLGVYLLKKSIKKS